jgi:hypothetical protein
MFFLGLQFSSTEYPHFLDFLHPFVVYSYWFLRMGMGFRLMVTLLQSDWLWSEGLAFSCYWLVGWGYGIGVFMLKELVMLMDLVWSMSYALLKKLICSNSVLLGVSLVILSKSFRVSRIALKCEIEA